MLVDVGAAIGRRGTRLAVGEVAASEAVLIGDGVADGLADAGRGVVDAPVGVVEENTLSSPTSFLPRSTEINALAISKIAPIVSNTMTVILFNEKNE